MRRLAIAFLLVCALGATDVACAATIALYPGAGVAGARLGAWDTAAVSAIRKVAPYSGRVVNKDYAQPVYEYRFGKRMAYGHYPIEMYAHKSHRVFTFEVNTPACVTAKGIRVGSTEAQLQKAYSSALKKRLTPTYIMYWSGGRTNRTDFYVNRSTKKISRILISRY